MSALAGWLRKNRPLRIAALLATFLLPLTNVVSGALLVITARRAGWRAAAADAGAAVFLLVVLVLATGGAPLPAALGAVALWAGALLGGTILTRYSSVDLAVQALLLAALLGVLAATLAIPDARAFWLPRLQELIQAAGLPQVGGLPEDWLGTVAGLMHGVIAASLVSTLVPALMLALWLDRDATAPEWRRRFLELRLGRVLSLAAGLAALLLLAGFEALGGGALLVLATGFIAQGLAVVHWTADHRGWPWIWPLGLYGPLLLGAPPAGLVLIGLALAGLLDNAVSLRRRRPDVV